ncbi:MAG TPA: NAD(P)/FAD-dependent oxidoreductase [Candidatus Binatia bacterium]|nr:NAD(P)/FAD-dependent oxidoreductase [Candidatus Binatia bacterium]
MPRDLDLKLSLDEAASDESLRAAVARRLRSDPERISSVEVLRRAIDARGAGAKLQLHVRVFLEDEARAPRPVAVSAPRLGPVSERGRPVVIIGTGPAGLFCALRLAELGARAVVLDRGKAVQARRRDIATLNKQGIVDPESNYCFGEGGAGTYSDGKLYTRADKRGPVAKVLGTLVSHGAPADILIDARPHIGSNKLPNVVKRLRETLVTAGTTVRFESRVVALHRERERILGVRLASGEEIEAPAVVVAAGHSARDVFALLAAAGVRLEAKPFAAGVRVEHPQPLIDEIQYGKDAGHPSLPAASYRLATTVAGRGVYSFCMCPGGWIVPSTTESEAIVVNGMSLSRRDSPFANSGIVVAIEPSDLQASDDGIFPGVRFQEAIEHRAWELGGGAQKAPAQRLTDFVAGRESQSLPRSSYRPGIRSAPLHVELPDFLSERLRAALERFGRVMKGFETSEAIVVGVESRSSSPIRVVRDLETLESPTLPGLFPCGEGAGHAGGIVSAALDGLRVAERVARTLTSR